MLQDKERALGYYAPSDTCHIGSVLSSRAVGVCPPLHKTPVFMGPSHSSGLAAKARLSPASTYYDPSRRQPAAFLTTHHRHLSSLPSPSTMLPSLLQLAGSPRPLIHYTHIVYYFLYFVEKFLEPQDPGDLSGSNKFREGLHAPPPPAPPDRSHWNSSSAVAPSCDLPLNSVALPP